MRSFLALVRKDFKGYFDQPTGYILIVLFTAVLSWSFFFQSNEVILGIASLRPLFSVDFVVEQPSIPWLLALFVPAATMRLIAEEQRDGTLEILLTQPIKGWVVLLTKFVSGLGFVSIAIVATISIPLSIQFSGAGNLDWGAIVAQYVGSIFLAASFVAIGLFTSSLTRNQIVSFILGLFFVLILMLIGLDQVGVTLPPQLATLLQTLSPLTHFSSIARGVIDLRDVLYFVALVSTFLSATFLSIRGKTLSHRSPQYRNLQLGTVALIVMSLLIGWFGNSVAGRLDLTADKTFTLSPGTRDIVSSLDDLLTIELFQSKEPPVEVDLVARDVSDFLKDLASGSGDNVKLIHRFPDVDDDDARKAQLAGIPPVQFNVQTANGLEIKNGYLGVVLTYTNLRESIPFVQSIDGFEYRIATLAYGMVQADVERKTLGFLAGHGEKTIREDLSTLVSLLAQQYEIREVTAVDDQAPDLSEIDVLIIAGPTQRMAEAVPDSIRDFLASGGKAMIMIDPVIVDQQSMFAIPNQFHFGEFVEEYGVVVEDNLVFDLRSNETLSFNTARGNIFLPYQYWARVPTVDKKVAGQVESVLLPWASSIGTTDSRVGDVEFIPLLRTTPFGVADYTYGDVSPNNPSLTNPNSRPFENDIGVAVEGSANGEGTFRLIVIGDSDWLTNPIVGRAQENLAMGLNLVDWLAQEDALADIRSKVITTRALIFDSPAQRNIVQYANILGVPLLFIVLGAVRYARRRRINLKVYSSEE